MWVPNKEEKERLRRCEAKDGQYEDESDDEDLQNWVLRRQEARAEREQHHEDLRREHPESSLQSENRFETFVEYSVHTGINGDSDSGDGAVAGQVKSEETAQVGDMLWRRKLEMHNDAKTTRKDPNLNNMKKQTRIQERRDWAEVQKCVKANAKHLEKHNDPGNWKYVEAEVEKAERELEENPLVDLQE